MKCQKQLMKSAKKNDEANKLQLEFKIIDETLDNVVLICTKTDGTNMTLIVFPFH